MSSNLSFKHHIIPLHEWKSRINPKANRYNKDYNALDNVVWLTLNQHIQAHQFLWELNGSEYDLIASKMLSGQMGKWEGTISAAKLANTGKVHTLETRQKLSRIRSGKAIHTQEWKDRQSASLKENSLCLGYKYTNEQRKTRSNSMKGKQNALGHHQSIEDRKKKSDSAKRRWVLWKREKTSS